MAHSDDINLMKVAQYIAQIRHLCDKLETEVERVANKGLKNEHNSDRQNDSNKV